jgi:hypothetical protein
LEFIMTEQSENRASNVDTARVQPLQSNEGENTGPNDPRNFEKEVHTWNPTLPMWRRSNKE